MKPFLRRVIRALSPQRFSYLLSHSSIIQVTSWFGISFFFLFNADIIYSLWPENNYRLSLMNSRPTSSHWCPFKHLPFAMILESKSVGSVGSPSDKFHVLSQHLDSFTFLQQNSRDKKPFLSTTKLRLLGSKLRLTGY